MRPDVANDGREAVEAHKQRPYDVILMDGQMPRLSGIEVAREIRTLDAGPSRSPRPRPCIIALTASVLTGERDKCLAAGMDDYLSKPAGTAALADALSRASANRAEALPCESA